MLNNQLLDYLPLYLRDYRELRAIMKVQQQEFDDLWVEKNRIRENAFVQSADRRGVERYEKMLGLVKKPSETLDERKFRIIVKINEQLPYTMGGLEEKLRNLCGADGYEVILSPADFTIGIKVALTAKDNFDAVKEMLRRILPCNIICWTTLIYNQHQTFHTFTHATLTAYTHEDLRNEVF